MKGLKILACLLLVTMLFSLLPTVFSGKSKGSPAEDDRKPDQSGETSSGEESTAPEEQPSVPDPVRYGITTTLSHVTGAEGNAVSIPENGTVSLTFAADAGYHLPESVQVVGIPDDLCPPDAEYGYYYIFYSANTSKKGFYILWTKEPMEDGSTDYIAGQGTAFALKITDGYLSGSYETLESVTAAIRTEQVVYTHTTSDFVYTNYGSTFTAGNPVRYSNDDTDWKYYGKVESGFVPLGISVIPCESGELTLEVPHSWNPETGVLTLTNPTADIRVRVRGGLYAVILNLSNVVVDSVYGPDVDHVSADGVRSVKLKATAGYILPETVTVTNADYTWDAATGCLTLNNLTADATVIAAGEKIPANVIIMSDEGMADPRYADYEVWNGDQLIWSGNSYDRPSNIGLTIDFTKQVKIVTDNPSGDRGFRVYNGSTVVGQTTDSNGTVILPAGTEFDRILFYDYN